MRHRSRSRAPAGRRLNSLAGGTLFTPASLPGLVLWLDPTYGLYQETTGASAATPAVADGDPVGTWLARTGQYLTAASDAARPTLKFSGGAPYLLFDGVDDLLSAAHTQVSAAGHYLCGRAMLSGDGSFPMLLVVNNGRYEARCGSTTRKFETVVNSTLATLSDSAALATDEWYSLIASHDFGAGTAELFRDAASVASGADSSDAGTFPADVLAVGARTTPSDFWPGGVRHIVYGEAVLPGGQAAPLSSFIADGL